MAHGRRLGQYELLEIAGQGEIFSLFRAHDIEHDRLVVLKLVHSHLQDDTDLIASFHRRTEELFGLRHPHILSVLDASFDQDVLYLVTETMEGQSLERRLAGHGPLEVDDILSIVSQIAEALDYAHEQGVCHHDVRPANIYLKDNTAALTDFYVLEAIGATPTYVAPEQLDETSAEAADRRTDAYALGVVVYEMLTGRPPYEGTTAEIAAAHLTQRPLSPRLHNPDLLPALDAILFKALAKQPKSRYQSAGELATALHEAVQTAATRRMSDAGVFDYTNENVHQSVFPKSETGVPMWVWVGLGILLMVVIASVILLAGG
jgi:serine/threonine-protein kinase